MCRHWYRLASDDSIWRPLVHEYEPDAQIHNDAGTMVDQVSVLVLMRMTFFGHVVSRTGLRVEEDL